jgi:hypothetical protein
MLFSPDNKMVRLNSSWIILAGKIVGQRTAWIRWPGPRRRSPIVGVRISKVP